MKSANITRCTAWTIPLLILFWHVSCSWGISWSSIRSSGKVSQESSINVKRYTKVMNFKRSMVR